MAVGDLRIYPRGYILNYVIRPLWGSIQAPSPSSRRRNRESHQVHVIESRAPATRRRRGGTDHRWPRARRRLAGAVSPRVNPSLRRSAQRVSVGSAHEPASEGSIVPCRKLAPNTTSSDEHGLQGKAPWLRRHLTRSTTMNSSRRLTSD